MHRTAGGVIAGTLFVLPGVIVIGVLSWLYATYQQLPAVTAIFFGLKAAVLAVVVEAVLRVGRRALKNRVMIAIAAAAFVALYFFKVPFPLVILSAALIGIAGRHWRSTSFPAPASTVALAESTPGPLIMVVQYVAFIAAFRHPGSLSPYAAGVLGSLLTTWVTFLPCFLWIFLGAPYIESLRSNRTLSAALSAITAAVVGVILNLSVWFAVHTVFHTVQVQAISLMRVDVPEWRSADFAALALSACALLAMLRFKLGMGWTLFGSAVLGAGIWTFFHGG